MSNRIFDFQGYQSHKHLLDGREAAGSLSVQDMELMIKEFCNTETHSILSNVNIQSLDAKEFEGFITLRVGEIFEDGDNALRLLGKLMMCKPDNRDDALNGGTLKTQSFEFSAQDVLDFIKSVVVRYLTGNIVHNVKANFNIQESSGKKMLLFDEGQVSPILYFYKCYGFDELGNFIVQDESKEAVLVNFLNNKTQKLDYAIEILPMNALDAITITSSFSKCLFAKDKSILSIDFLSKIIKYVKYAKPDNNILLKSSDVCIAQDMQENYNQCKALNFRNIENVEELIALFNDSLLDAYTIIYNICFASYVLPSSKKKSVQLNTES